MNTVITITTIHKPVFLEGLCENIRRYGHDPSILIIGDFKTPPIQTYCNSVGRKYDVPVEYLNLDGQEEVLQELIPDHYEDLMDMFPVNTPDRVILGGMISYLRGAERIVAVDDDNFATDDDFVGGHEIVGRKTSLTLIESDTGWYNVHDHLVEKNEIEFYPRGFPWKQRKPQLCKAGLCLNPEVVVNQGLVLGDPDIDAIQRLAHPIEALAAIAVPFGLAKGTWSPFNYQNTCLTRELIPCYYRPPSTLRNGDIWVAYVFNRLAEHMGGTISFGRPLVKQVRNDHDLWDDLRIEMENNVATDEFVAILRDIKPVSMTYFDALCELVEQGRRYKTHYNMIKSFFVEYQQWLSVVRAIR